MKVPHKIKSEANKKESTGVKNIRILQNIVVSDNNKDTLNNSDATAEQENHGRSFPFCYYELNLLVAKDILNISQ